MRLTPQLKVFLYLTTVAPEAGPPDCVWREQYQLDPPRASDWLERHGYRYAGAAGLTLTPRGHAALADIADWLWIHEYYLPGVVDFAHAQARWGRPARVGYRGVQALLAAALAQHDKDAAYVGVLLRHRLRLELNTRHNQAAVQTLMALIDHELALPRPIDPTQFSYETTWAKMTEFEISTVKTLLTRLNWTLSDFEFAFAQFLTARPHHNRLFTRLEVMTIVMYELANRTAELVAVYARAAARVPMTA